MRFAAPLRSMGSWFSKQYAALKDAAGIRWGLVSLLVFLAVARLKWLYAFVVGQTTGAESVIGSLSEWLLGLVAFLGLWSWWLLQYAVKLRSQINDARVEISKLRNRGVELRNQGRLITSMTEWLKWHKETGEWHTTVSTAIRKISTADAEWWDCLDVVPRPRLPIIKEFIAEGVDAGEHRKRYREHDFQLRRLGKMIRDLWGRH
jgi:hypothetical protein